MIRPSGPGGTTEEASPAAPAAVWRKATPWLVFAVFVIATAARGTGPFYWDADHYWRATQAIVGITPDVPAGYWDLRGFWTAFVYAPAAAATRLFGAESAGVAVLIQNSLVFGAVAAFLLPALLAKWQRVTLPMRWVGAALFWAATSGFAAFPLVDVYPVIAVLAVILLLPSQRFWVVLLAGAFAGIAVNLRPAYLVVIALVTIVVVVWRRWIGLWFPAGILAALIPQLVANVSSSGRWSILPGASDGLVALQAGYAAYTVRYDTMINSANARQFFCSPEMARAVGDSPPASGGELALTFLQNMPASIQFALEKVAAALSWQVSIPYAVPARAIDVVFALAITLITVFGITALLFFSFRRTGDPAVRDGFGSAILIAVVLGTALTLVSSATESRFALMLVVLGVLGITLLVGPDFRRNWRQAKWWAIAAAAVTALVLLFAYTGLDNPAPRGDVTPTICATS